MGTNREANSLLKGDKQLNNQILKRTLKMKVIKFAKNSTDIRIAYNNGRAVASIVKLPTNQYRVVKMYDGFVWDCDTYSEAREIALNAPTTLPKPVYGNVVNSNEAANHA